MDSIWFSCEESNEDETSETFMGCLNQPPKMIASWLTRPATPLNFYEKSPTMLQVNIDDSNFYTLRNDPRKLREISLKEIET